MSSAARSGRAVLSGPVAVCVDRPVLALDRPFTYDLPSELGAGVGSLVQVPFHGRRVRGWVLGPTDDVPARMLKVRSSISPVRFFDASLLELFRWMAERYVAPLAAVIARSHPPRVAGEEPGEVAAVGAVAGLSGGRLASSPRLPARLRAPGESVAGPVPWSARYHGWEQMVAAVRGGGGTFVLRPAHGDQIDTAIATIGAGLDSGRTAIVLVPEAEPPPAIAVAVAEALGDALAMFLGGDKRARYRMWLDIAAGRYGVVVGTRGAVFAPLEDLGVMLVSREHHSLHREERSPYFHVRDAAVKRAQLAGAACVLSSICPSLEARAIPHAAVEPSTRWWPPVEVVRPGPEGRAPRVVRALGQARSGLIYEPMRGYGVARVCKACGEPAACAVCRGILRAEEGSIRCSVCGADGRCANCGGTVFGIARGGAERVEEWARGTARVRVMRARSSAPPRPHAEGILVGGLEVLKDVGPVELDLVAIVNADASLSRPGVGAREQALSAWMEAASWARPDGRVIVQTNRPSDPAIQALVTGNPERFARSEVARRSEAGFPPGAPVYRVVGSAELEGELRGLQPRTMLATSLEDRTVCLLALDLTDVARFSGAARRLAERGVVTRVEAEPHL